MAGGTAPALVMGGTDGGSSSPAPQAGERKRVDVEQWARLPLRVCETRRRGARMAPPLREAVAFRLTSGRVFGEYQSAKI